MATSETFEKKKSYSFKLSTEENNYLTQNGGIHHLIKDHQTKITTQTQTEKACDYRLKDAKGHLYCIYQSYGRHRRLLDTTPEAEECLKCKIWLFNLPGHTAENNKIPTCPKTHGLYNPKACAECWEKDAATFGTCETQKFFRLDTIAPEKQAAPRKKSLEDLKERERIKMEAAAEREKIRLDAKEKQAELDAQQQAAKERARALYRQSSASTSNFDMGNSEGFNNEDLGDGYVG